MEINGGTILEIYADEALKIKNSHPFKGNMDLDKLRDVITKYGVEWMPAPTGLKNLWPNSKKISEIVSRESVF